MWLLSDEQRLLRCFYYIIGCVDRECSFNLEELVRCLVCKNMKELKRRVEKGQEKSRDIVQYVDERIDERKRVEVAIKTLRKRDFITLKEYSGERQVKCISLSVQGLDLAKKYSYWWTRSGLWYGEYIKHHWICVLGSFLSGILITLLSQWLWLKIIR